MILSKTNYLLFRECKDNAWLKINKPEIYRLNELSDFEKMILETGIEVDELARKLFPGGFLVNGNNEVSQNLIAKKEKVIYQPVFKTPKFKAICDILVYNEKEKAYDLYEAKSTNSEKEGLIKKKLNELYSYDIAFQLNVLKELEIKIANVYLIRLNRDYIREDKLNIFELFKIEDFNENVNEVLNDCYLEMNLAYDSLINSKEPNKCSCIYKTKTNHCTSFYYLNKNIPNYSIYDIARISKKKVIELMDNSIISISQVPDDFSLTDRQRKQVEAFNLNRSFINKEKLKKFIDKIEFPLSFIDYETLPSAVPKYENYQPYHHIPFQFSLHILNKFEEELKHFEFLHPENTRPDLNFLKNLKKYLPKSGSIMVWNKSFEMGINHNLSKRNPEYHDFLNNFNDRIVDLEIPFKEQLYVHPGFKGKSSIKYILPILSPKLSYNQLNIQEGGAACEVYKRLIDDNYNKDERAEKIQDLLAYCRLDTLAMYEIYKHIISIL
jgi:hypothetical protein